MSSSTIVLPSSPISSSSSSMSTSNDQIVKKWDLVNWWENLKNIGVIDLSHNRLTNIPEGLTGLIRAGVEVRLDHNPMRQRLMNLSHLLQCSEASLTRPNGGYSVGWSELVGKRPTQEDCFCFGGTIGDPKFDITLFGLFDGHGSRAAAKFASENFSEHLSKHVPFKNLESAPAKALQNTFYSINEAWHRTLHSGLTPFAKVDLFAGSTGVVVIIVGDKLFSANIGDSRAVLYKGGSDKADATACEPFTVRLTFDHKPESEEEEKRIRNAGGHVIDNRLAGVLSVSRGIGDFYLSPFVSSEAHISMLSLPKHRDSFLLICCDGFWDVLDDVEAVALVLQVQKAQNLHTTASVLRDFAFFLGSDDNISTMIVKWDKKEIIL